MEFTHAGDLNALYRPFVNMFWRTGRRVGQCVHAQVGDEPNENDILLFCCPSPQMAAMIVDEHNREMEMVE